MINGISSFHFCRASGNKFSHLSQSEFAEKYLMSTSRTASTAQMTAGTFSTAALPTATAAYAASVNWVTAGKVTAVKNQGGCGECQGRMSGGCVHGYA